LLVFIGERRYEKGAYVAPEKDTLYSVRDKARGERIIQVVEVSSDGDSVEVAPLVEGRRSKRRIQLSVDSLARQAAKGWCNLLLPVGFGDNCPITTPTPADAYTGPAVALRLDIQNFSRCCADIVRANLKFDTQQIKDIGDGPFRAGNYEQAFRLFEQCAVGFGSAVAASRRTIADGRRALMAQKANLSGKEIQERTAAFVRSEQLIHTAVREFSAILEGLRMYLRSQLEPPPN
jgi:hypothetical protein